MGGFEMEGQGKEHPIDCIHIRVRICQSLLDRALILALGAGSWNFVAGTSEWHASRIDEVLTEISVGVHPSVLLNRATSDPLFTRNPELLHRMVVVVGFHNHRRPRPHRLKVGDVFAGIGSLRAYPSQRESAVALLLQREETASIQPEISGAFAIAGHNEIPPMLNTASSKFMHGRVRRIDCGDNE